VGSRPPLLVTRWHLAALFRVHAATVNLWQHEGLDAARVDRGGPGRPATYDGARAVAWFNATKAHYFQPTTLDELRAIVAARPAPGRPSTAAPAAMRGDQP
jgi:hypothetical protein